MCKHVFALFSLFKLIKNSFFRSFKIAYISGNFNISKPFLNTTIHKVFSITFFKIRR
jgi:hypothetical protein